MRVTDVTAHKLSSPIDPPQERRFHGGVRRLLKRDVVLVVVETADGEVGYAPAGASSSAMREYFEGASHGDFAEVLETTVADALAGESIERPERIRELVEATGLPELLSWQATAAIDIAYHDLWGKEADARVADLLVERYGVNETPTDTMALYASGGMYMPPEGYAEQARALAERGFGGYKYRPGLGPEEDLRTIRLIREAVGDDVDVMVDAHTWWKMGERSYDAGTVEGLITDMAAYDPYWVEEPVPPDDHDGYRRLADATPVALAGGESEESPAGLIALAGTGVEFLQGDVRHHGGFTGCWTAVEHCVGRDVTYVPHHFGTHLGLVANAHLVAAAPEADLLEYPVFGDGPAGMYPFPLAEDVLETEVDVRDGRLTLPDGPGLGVAVNRAVVEQYPYVEGAWTEFSYGA